MALSSRELSAPPAISPVKADLSAKHRSFLLHEKGPVDIVLSDKDISAIAQSGAVASFEFSDTGSSLTLKRFNADQSDAFTLTCAVLEYLFSSKGSLESIHLTGENWASVLPRLIENGVATIYPARESQPRIMASMLWQLPELWMQKPASPYPRHDVFDGKVEHPLRPEKPSGRIYARYIPWLGGTFSFDVAAHDDLPLLHRWMNSPRVNQFWNEAGTIQDHERYLNRVSGDPHMIPLIGRFEGKPFSYFEIYWAKEDIIGPFCAAGDYDRGCHVIIGEEEYRGKAWFTAWLPSLVHLMFLADPRTQRVVQEPSADHHRQLRNLQRSGFSHLRTADLPGKRAAIMALTRQHFFSNRLWHPVETN